MQSKVLLIICELSECFKLCIYLEPIGYFSAHDTIVITAENKNGKISHEIQVSCMWLYFPYTKDTRSPVHALGVFLLPPLKVLTKVT